MSKTRKPVPIGEKFGRLTVISQAPSRISLKDVQIFCVNVKCDCGNEKIVAEYKLRQGFSKSCGCLPRGSKGNPLYKIYKKEYKTWCMMKDRCSNTAPERIYKHYAGKGIKVCDRWLKDFQNFLYDMGNHPGEDYTLDRKENDKGYELNNCRWATRHMQTRNQKNNKNVILNGILMCQTDATKILNVDGAKISRMVKQLGITHQKAVDLLMIKPKPINIKKFREILEKEKKE